MLFIFPIGDDNRDRRSSPLLNIALIAANVFVFFVLQQGGLNERFTYALSCIPQEIVTGEDVARTVPIYEPGTRRLLGRIELQETPGSVYLTLLSSMFMHGSLVHLFGNMLYLWIFGDNLEDRLGRARYLAFYLATGVIASLSHVASTYAFGGNPLIPSLGASGAISGVLGGYLVLFPSRRVTVILFRMLTQVPAVVAIGLWFAFQVLSGAMSGGGGGGGVAYGAHIGGFLAGLLLVKLFAVGAGGGGDGRGPRTAGAVVDSWR